MVNKGEGLFNTIYRENGGAWPRQYKFNLFNYILSTKPFDPDTGIAYNLKVDWKPKYAPPSSQLGIATTKEGIAKIGMAGNKMFSVDKRSGVSSYEDNKGGTLYFKFNDFQTPGSGPSEMAVGQAISSIMAVLAQRERESWGNK